MALSFFQRRNIPDVVGSVLKGVTQAATSVSPVGPLVSAYNSVSNSIKPNQAYKQPVNQAQAQTQNYSQQQNQPQAQTQPNAPTSPNYNSYLDRLRQLSEQQTQRYDARAAENARLLRESYGKQNEAQAARIPQLQQAFGQYQGDVQGQIGDEEARAAQEQESTRETYGEALRRSAQANRESQGQLQNIFANLGTIDSKAFQNQMINQQAKFAGGQQSTLKQQAGAISDIGRNLSDFKRQAVQAIRNEEQTLYDRISQINTSIQQGTAEYEQAIRQAYADAEDAVANIESQLTQSEMSVAQEQSKGGANQDTAMQLKNEALNAVNQLLNIGSPGLSGPIGSTGLSGSILGSASDQYLGTQYITAKSLFDKLKSILSLENRQLLRGSGTISDREQATLEKAATELRPGLSSPELNRILRETQAALIGEGGYSSQGNGQAYAGNFNQNDPLGLY